jgi:adenylate kinase
MVRNKPINILLVGPSGGGKGTQAVLIAEKFGMKHLQSGEILRRWASQDDEFGKKVNEAMLKGFVPSEWIFRIIEEEFKKVDEGKGLVLDSFSRILPEAKMLYDVLEKSGRKLDYVFFVKVSDEEAMRRLSKRAVCRECKEIMMIDEIRDMKCVKCGGDVEIRKDDNPESIKKRLNEFKSKTSEVINYIRENGRLIEIDGEQPKEKVFEDIIEHIKQ